MPPSSRITMGFIGVGTQGGGHLYGGAWTSLPGGFLARGDVQVLAVCDIQQKRREYALSRVNDHYAGSSSAGGGHVCQGYVDFRDVLARPDIDAVLIATPIHWHALMSIMAARAGKDVYCEKPTALTITESRAIADTFTRCGKIFQAGTQQRSEYGGKFRMACELVRGGAIGRLKEVWAYERGGGFAAPYLAGPPQKVPPEIDWELFLGPAPWQPYKGNISAHLFGYGGINWGQHHYDIVNWAIGKDEDPRDLGVEDATLVMRYADGVTIYGAKYPDPSLGLQGDLKKFAGEGGAVFVGSDGLIAVDRQQLLSNPADILRCPIPPDAPRLYFSGSHAENFLRCIGSRRPAICDAEVAHRSAKLLLLGGIAGQSGKKLRWDSRRERFDDDAANRQLSVAYREPWRNI